MSDSYDRLCKLSEVPTEPHSHLSRRTFLGVSAATSVAATLSPLFAASETLQLGRILVDPNLLARGGGCE